VTERRRGKPVAALAALLFAAPLAALVVRALADEWRARHGPTVSRS